MDNSDFIYNNQEIIVEVLKFPTDRKLIDILGIYTKNDGEVIVIEKDSYSGNPQIIYSIISNLEVRTIDRRNFNYSFYETSFCGDGNKIFVSDADSNQLILIENDKQTVLLDEKTLFSPRSITIDRQGNLYICDTGNNRVLKLTCDNEIIIVNNYPPDPTNICLNNKGEIIIAHQRYHYIQKIGLDGNVDIILGTTEKCNGADRFPIKCNYPYIISSLGSNIVFIDVSQSDDLKVILKNGRLITLDTKMYANFGIISGLTVDNNNNIYICCNYGILRVRPKPNIEKALLIMNGYYDNKILLPYDLIRIIIIMTTTTWDNV
jgi:hypothetical protein